MNHMILSQAEQIRKITIIFTKTGQKLSFWVKIVVILLTCNNSIFSLEIIHMTQQLTEAS